MSPPPDSRTHRTGEWNVIKNDIESAVKDAVKKALEGDSGFARGTDSDEAHQKEIRGLVKEMRAAMITNAGDLRQQLIDLVGANSTEVRALVREEISLVRIQINGLEGAVREFRLELGEIRTSLHEGDTNFAVLGTRMDSLKEDMDRSRGHTPVNSMTAASTGLTSVQVPVDYRPSRSREVSTDRHVSKTSREEKPLISPKIMNIVIVAILSALGTGVGTLLVDMVARGAKDTIKDAAHERPKDASGAPGAP
jgi:hypothetical protein